LPFKELHEKKITPIHYETLIKIFELDGFVVQRKKGDHTIMTKAGIKRPLVIKTTPKHVPVTHIRTNMTTAGMTRERFFKLMEAAK
jgi:predicted RNA binding protein YcfA (HicA-like mRNA interferase family)